MEVPSSSKTRDGDEELEPEDVWSDLHALRKLYVLLQRTSAKIPHGQCQDGLDDKSRLLLKNLLDDATQKALQSQGQILSCTPHPPPTEAKPHEGTKSNPSSPENIIRKESQSPENLQKCHPAEKNEAHGPLVGEATPSLRNKEIGIPPRVESQIEPKRCPHCDLTRLESERTPDGRAGHHRQTQHGPDRVSIDRSSTATKNTHRPSAEHGMRGTSEPESRGKPRQSRSPPGGTRLADISTRRTMSQKRSRVDAESTRMKGSRPESLRRSTSTKDGRPKRTCLPDRTAQIHELEKRKGASPSIRKDHITRQLSERRLTRTEKAPSRRRSPSRKEHANRELSMRSVRHQVGPHGSILPPRIPRRRHSMAHSSVSGTTRSDSSTSEESASPPTSAEIVPRRMPSRDRSPPKRVPPPRRRLGHHRTMPPSRVSAEATKADHEKKQEKRDGRLRRFKDKLAIIFHHHHHHHHYHHQHGHADGDDAGKDGGAHHHGSQQCKHLGRTPHHASEEGRGKLVTEADAERVVARAPAQHQHGYFRQLLGALVRHVWRSRKMKAVRADRGRLGRSASRVRVKKLHWWQRFRRRGGVKLANGKKPRLRLGFSKKNTRATKS